MISKEALKKQTAQFSYKLENYEKVHQLLFVLEQLMKIPYLKKRLVLKGGTALNLFHFDPIPRLSVDIDLNYIGHISRTEMLKEKELINEAINQILIQHKFFPDRAPTQHAGAKNIWKYDSVLGQKGNLEIDLNYMYRKPLWPIVELAPKVDFSSAFTVPVLDIHELAAGKLTALFSRRVSRDLFDAHHLLINCDLNKKRLRESFVIYLSCSNVVMKKISTDTLYYDVLDIRNKLFPLLNQKNCPRKKTDVEKWGQQILYELKEKLTILLPLEKPEIDFIRLIRDQGEVKPELITEDRNLIDVVLTHPLIQWKVLNKKIS